MKDHLHRQTRTWSIGLCLTVALLLITQLVNAQITQTFNSSGTFVVPAGVSQVTVECWGGGGRGSTRTSNGAGGGGGGGAYSRSTISVIEGNSYTYTVGAGSNSASPGGDSWFINATTVMAEGGNSVANNTSGGATGGAAGSGFGTVKFSGGNGANGGSTGGGAGSSAGTAAIGANGSGQNGGNAPAGGGDGGDGGNAGFLAGAGVAGSAPGGGGGGAERNSFSGNQNGGNGANGRVVLTYTPCTGPTVSVSPGSPTICVGGSVVLTASGASASYSWSPNTGLSSTSGAVVTANPTSTTTYTVTGLNTGCSIPDAQTVTVTVNPAPTIPVMTPTSATTCSGSPTGLSASSTTSASVTSSPFNSTGGPANITTGAAQNASVYPFNNSVSGLPTSGVTVESVTINGITHTYSDDLDFLLQSPTGTNVILMSDVGGSNALTSVSYTFETGSPSMSDAGANVTGSYAPTNIGTPDDWPTAPGPGNGFSQASPTLNSFTGNFNGVWKLLIRDDANGDGGSVTSWSITFSYPATVSYAWSPNIALSATTGASVTASPTSTQAYTVTVSHTANSCTRTGNVTVTTVTPPNAGTNGTLVICSNAAPSSLFTQLGGTPNGGGTWSGPSTVSAGMYDPTTMNPGVYTYLVTAPPCAPASATVTVTENTATPWYADDDNDGFGDAGDMVMACTAPGGYIADNTDCDDTQELFTDADGDGFGAGSPVACGVANNTDCNDAALLHADVDGDGFGAAANAPCGIADNSDCDDTQLLYTDTDGDGFGTGAPVACGVADNSDCDDTQNLYADGDGDGFGAGAPVACGVADNTDCNDAQLQYADADGDGFGAGAPVACGIADNTDCDDTQNLYADTDGDGYGAGAPVACGVTNNDDDCPAVFGIVGSACDAGPSFVLGELDGSCNCVGVACTTNLNLDVTIPAFGTLPTWELRDAASNLLVQSGGGGFGFAGINPTTTCLPDGTFKLIVNGMPAGGAYVLRTSGNPGIRIIDNQTANNGSSQVTEFSTTPIILSSTGPVHIPVGPTEVLFTSCDKPFWKSGEYVVLNEDADVAATWVPNAPDNAQSATSGYDFWIYNPNGGYSYIRQRRNNVSDNFAAVGSARTCHMKVNNWAAVNHIPNNVKMNIRVRAVVNNVPKNWGPACRFIRDEALANCPPTKLFDVPGFPQFFSCGVTKEFNSQASNRLYARPVTGANKYKFTISSAELAVPIVKIVNTYYLNLGWTSGPLMNDGETYDVTVQASTNGGATYCVVGDVCLVTIQNNVNGGQQNIATDSNTATLNMWPNPNNGDQLNVSLSAIEDGVNTVSMDIYDLSGKRMMARTLAAQDGFLNTVVDLNGDLNAGMYIVNITAGDVVYTQRVVIQK
ncbi:MAG: T9SS type A sorting domain-containing protein [Flavobacteriales bacterium]